MVSRFIILVLLLSALSACSGTIYRTSTLSESAPVAISVDARQRILLSQLGQDKTANPNFRRFCAEPSPDVFTVLGVAASGGGSLDVGGSNPKSVSAALQAAFSSSETGATIARTQTVTMLREMMFCTCERYLSGAISADEFPIIAARDQRIMVSILAIEQLTGSITPRAVAITAGGNASTGYNPTEMVKLLADGQAALKDAEGDVAVKTKKLGDADLPAGNCAVLRKKKADGTPPMAADETAKLDACDKAQAELSTSIAKRDLAQARYDDLVRGSRSGLGVSSAATSGKTEFGESQSRSDNAVIAVALSVGKIVGNTFAQDETQLFCIRALTGQARLSPIYDECVKYLLQKVAADRKQLAAQYGLTPSTYDDAVDGGRKINQQRELLTRKIEICTRAAEAPAFRKALLSNSLSATSVDALFASAKQSSAALQAYLFDQGGDFESKASQAVDAACNFGD